MKIQKRSLLLIAAVTLALAAGAVAVGAAVNHTRPAASPPAPASLKPTASQVTGTQAQQKPPTVLNGTVEGSISYPAGGIPNDLRVCAMNVGNGSEFCTSERLPVGDGTGYRLSVPEGTYQVYAIVPSFDPGYRAYYSAFVTCGYRESCTDHTAIDVTVRAGQTVGGIEPGDFYDL